MRKHLKDLLYSVLTVFMIVFVYSIYDNFPIFYNKFVPIVNKDDVIMLHDDYYNFAPKNQLIDKYEKVTPLKRIVSPQSEFWLLYISSLIHNSENYKATYTIWRYLRNISDLRDLYRFLNICDFATRHGFKRQEIEKSARIFRKFEDTRKNNMLYHILRGKTVALVGNGPYEVGKKSGKEIDAHDIVIRMNNYVIDGYEEDYGSKTDIWIYGFGGEDIEDKSLNNDYLYVGMTGDYRYLPLFFDFQRERLYRDMFERKINIGTIEPDFYREFRYEFNFEPSTGLVLIYTLRKWNIDFDVYGFSFLQKDLLSINYAYHYFPTTTPVPQPHPVDKESELLSSWFEGRHIKNLGEDKYD